MNSLVDRECIAALYRASQAGVEVELNVRGICCLRPGVPGVSENIRVSSVVGRFLEHSRIYAFERDGDTTIYIGSADLMPRNLDTRVELLTPVRNGSLRAELVDSMDRCQADDTNSWELGENGKWVRRTPGPGTAERAAGAHGAPRRASRGDPGRAAHRAARLSRPPTSSSGRSGSASASPSRRCPPRRA